MKCEKCGAESFLPFQCTYCRGQFCDKHRLPENHDCARIEQARELKPETYQNTWTYSLAITVNSKKHFRGRFSKTEAEHLCLAALLVIGVGLSFFKFPQISENYLIASLFSALFAASFFIHEFAHKIVAQKYGLWAEFRLTYLGAALTLLSSFIPIKFISPGAVTVSGYSDNRRIGKISVAGPVTNMLLSTVFLGTSFLSTDYAGLLILASAFNSWIAMFNLIPFGILDGFKVFHWSKAVWIIAFLVGLMLVIISYPGLILRS